MNQLTCTVMNKMTEFFAAQPKQIHHFLKVAAFCDAIAMGENLDETLRQRLVICGLVHDIGIKPADEKYGHHEGPLQEQEGPAAARPLLAECGLGQEEVDRQCWLIAHHHTYTNVTDIDHQVLLEADFLVNAYESAEPKEAILAMRKNVFRTATGIRLLDTMYGL